MCLLQRTVIHAYHREASNFSLKNGHGLDGFYEETLRSVQLKNGQFQLKIVTFSYKQANFN